MTDSLRQTTDTDLRKFGNEVMTDVLRTAFPDAPVREAGPDGEPPDRRDGRLADEIVDIGLVGIWAQLWGRPGLSRRDRSLVTISILIALGAEQELSSHVKIGLGNGLTRDEISEVIYHAAGYAGFPRAVAARTAARTALGEN
ncbi:carboxymuconolactone decarboxylase [Amycolatopsis sp. NBRC 101858]|uniref:carboxymuconolactone decarboxylase family protein n=1 Tax=Amycolatopsis sp. NBRC 101858 TaxID=3032200 RepID=UPI0024A12963|nr:carboxymuconolactone decarboxylase family protein [Amycolatopsis sp. NBRC 101858]GLY38926.1 carboxymuconolactone decarboxylase [Amycolatopsis sp. NBRC 101858]